MIDFKPDDFDSFCKVIRDTIALFEELNEYENKKLDAIAANNVLELDKYLNDEQAYLMKMRGLDSKREKLQQQLGVTGLPFKEIIEKFDGRERDSLNSLYDELSEKSTELKNAITATRKYIELHLNTISAMLAKLEGSEGTYDKKGEKEPKTPPERFTPTKA